MKLYIHDQKHEQIVGLLELGTLNASEINLVENIIKFLGEYGITNRYKELVLAESHESVNDEDGFPNIHFH